MNPLRFPFTLAVFCLLAPALPAAPITAAGRKITVPAGAFEIGDRVVTVAGTVTLDVPVAPTVFVKDEALKLSVDKPEGWAKGTRLKGCNARDVNAFGSFEPGSLEIRKSAGGELLVENQDYLVDPGWGHVGLGPKSRVTENDTVLASYRYALARIDTVEVSADGLASLKQGQPRVSAPLPPEADPGSTAIAHLLIEPLHAALTADDVYPILETSAQAVTKSVAGRIPKTLAKLRAGEPVAIVCWGDSVTAGGNASRPERRYVDLFGAELRARFPKAAIDVKNISAGGSNSRQWLFPEQHPYKGLHGDANPAQFKYVLAAKPDLVTIEFVNDAPLTPAQVEETYTDILRRLEPLGSEVILIAPHFTMWKMMKFESMRQSEKRPYVLALREFAEKHHVGLADASARWEHLWKEGIPYLTLLDNTINHPDDRGHRIFADELMKCFE